MPTLHPADVWQATGRYDAIGDEMFRLKDRGGRKMVLAMTHEEVFAWLASKELRSYRDLPRIWYQIQLKFRDEPRPKGGVLRVREFIMKDSYSFDMDEAGLEKSYEKHIGAYDRIFERCGVQFLRVESDSGIMGGAQAHEYMAPSAAGEDRVAVCTEPANMPQTWNSRVLWRPAAGEAAARGRPRRWPPPTSAPSPRCRSSSRWRPSLIKSLLYMAGEKPVLALVRGDHDLHENKLARYLKAEVRPAHPEEVLEFVGVEVGFVGPVGPPTRTAHRGRRDLAARRSRGPREYAAGANKPHTHLLAWSPAGTSRPSRPTCARRRPATAARSAARHRPWTWSSKWATSSSWAPSTPSRSTPLFWTNRQETPIIMGSYGIGPARIAAAAVEQHPDEKGIMWPKAIAPFDVHLVQVQPKDEPQTGVADPLYQALPPTATTSSGTTVRSVRGSSSRTPN